MRLCFTIAAFAVYGYVKHSAELDAYEQVDDAPKATLHLLCGCIFWKKYYFTKTRSPCPMVDYVSPKFKVASLAYIAFTHQRQMIQPII